MGGSVFPPYYLTSEQNMVDVMKIMMTSFKRSCAGSATLSTLNLAAGHHQPTPPPETPGHSRACLGQSPVGSPLLSPWSWCAQASVCALQESVSPVLCKFWRLYGGLMVTSSKRACARPRSAAPRAPAPAAGHCWPVPPQEMLKHSSVWVSVGSLDPGAQKVCWVPWASLVDLGFDSKCDLTPPSILLWLLCPWTWGISSQLLQHHAAPALALSTGHWSV